MYFICLTSLCSQQIPDWRYTIPYPFAQELVFKEGMLGENYLIHRSLDVYKVEKCGFTKIEIPAPTYSNGQSYQFQNFNSDITMINDSTWFINYFSTFYTADGGKSYISNNKILMLNNVKFVTLDIAYGVEMDITNKYHLVKSVDKGMTWERLKESKGKFTILDEDKIYLVEDEHYLYLSIDSGENWKLVNDEFYAEISHVQDSIVLGIMGIFPKISRNFGENFDFASPFDIDLTQPVGGGQPILKWINDSTWVGKFSEYIFYTVDSGKKWKKFYPLDKIGLQLKNFYILDSTEILVRANGLFVFNLKEEKITNCSTYSPDYRFIKSTLQLNDSTFYMYEGVSGYGGNFLIESTDSLKTFHLKANLPYNNYNYNEGILKVDDNKKAYFVLDTILYKAELPHTDWEIVGVISDEIILKFEILSENKFVAASSKHIYISNNGGLDWEIVPDFTFELLQLPKNIYKIDENSFWINYHDLNFQSFSYLRIEGKEIVDSLIINIGSLFKHPNAIVYKDKLYISTHNSNLIYNTTTKELLPFCSFGGRGFMKIYSEDSIYVTSKNNTYPKDIWLVDEDCNFKSSTSIQYNYTNEYYGRSLLHFYNEEEGVILTENGHVLRMTKNFRPNITTSRNEYTNNEEDVRSIYLYPNPTTGQVTISENLKEPLVYFYNMQGQYAGVFQDNVFDISDFAPGIYAYAIFSEGKLVYIGKHVKE